MDVYNIPYWNNNMNNDVLEAIEDLEIGRDVLQPTDPFLLSNRKFIQIFRLSKDMVTEVVEMVSPFMEAQSRASALSITTRVSKQIYMCVYICVHTERTRTIILSE